MKLIAKEFLFSQTEVLPNSDVLADVQYVAGVVLDPAYGGDCNFVSRTTRVLVDKSVVNKA